MVLSLSVVVLLGAYSLFGGGASLCTGALVKRFSPVGLMFIMVGVTIISVTMTPALGAYWLLFIAASMNGAAYGLTQPLAIILMSRGSGAQHQGKAAGLRTSANRLAATVIPPIMGAVAEFAGIGMSFYIVGGTVLALLVLAALFTHRIGAADGV